ncbi:MAG: nuclear transport factor 2 family protein [Acidobacteriota bacterium]
MTRATPTLTLACALVLGALVCPAHARAQEQRQGDEARVMAVLETMAQATITKDMAMLDQVFHRELIYEHTNGLTQTKAEALKLLAGWNVRSMKFLDPTIRFYGSVALVKTITLLQTVRRDGTSAPDSRLDVLWVLVKESGGWQIVARHTTRLGSAKTD